jgi:hypothetical protein
VGVDIELIRRKLPVLIQLSVQDRCVLVRLQHAQVESVELENFLKDRSILKVGAGLFVVSVPNYLVLYFYIYIFIFSFAGCSPSLQELYMDCRFDFRLSILRS